MSPFPQDVVLEIVPYLSIYDGISLSNVSRKFRNMQERGIFWIVLLERARVFRPLPCHPFTVFADMDVESLKALAVKAMRVDRNLSVAQPKIVGPIRRKRFRDHDDFPGIRFHVPGTSLVVLQIMKEGSNGWQCEIVCWNFATESEHCSISVIPPFRFLKGVQEMNPIWVFPNRCTVYTLYHFRDGSNRSRLAFLTLHHSQDFSSIRLEESHVDIQGIFTSATLNHDMSIAALFQCTSALTATDVIIQFVQLSSAHEHILTISGMLGRTSDCKCFFHGNHLHVIVLYNDENTAAQYITIDVRALTFLEPHTRSQLDLQELDPSVLLTLPNKIRNVSINTYGNLIICSPYTTSNFAVYTFPLKHTPKIHQANVYYPFGNVEFPGLVVSLQSYGSSAFLLQCAGLRPCLIRFTYPTAPLAEVQHKASESPIIELTGATSPLPQLVGDHGFFIGAVDDGQGLILSMDNRYPGCVGVISYV